MSEPVQQGTGEPLGAKDFRPFLEGQVRGLSFLAFSPNFFELSVKKNGIVG